MIKISTLRHRSLWHYGAGWRRGRLQRRSSPFAFAHDGVGKTLGLVLDQQIPLKWVSFRSAATAKGQTIQSNPADEPLVGARFPPQSNQINHLRA